MSALMRSLAMAVSAVFTADAVRRSGHPVVERRSRIDGRGARVKRGNAADAKGDKPGKTGPGAVARASTEELTATKATDGTDREEVAAEPGTRSQADEPGSIEKPGSPPAPLVVNREQPPRPFQGEEPPSLDELRAHVEDHSSAGGGTRGESPSDEFSADPVVPLGGNETSHVGRREAYDHHYHDFEGLREIPRPEPLIGGVLNRREYHVLSGRGGSYKSMVAVDWALSIATGTPWLGRPVHQGRVLYIAAEGVGGLRARIEAWLADRGVALDPAMLTVRDSGVDMFDPNDDFHDLYERVATGGYSLVVIDTLRKVSGAADENSSQMGKVIDNIAKVQHASGDTAVLVIAHTTKDGKVTRGFSGIVDDADIVWSTTVQDKTAPTAVGLSNTKNKNGPPEPDIVLIAKPCEGSVVMVEATEAGGRSTSHMSHARTQDQEWVLDQVKREPGQKIGAYTTRDGGKIYPVMNKLETLGLVKLQKSGTSKLVYPV